MTTTIYKTHVVLAVSCITSWAKKRRFLLVCTQNDHIRPYLSICELVDLVVYQSNGHVIVRGFMGNLLVIAINLE